MSITYLEAIREAQAKLLRDDERVAQALKESEGRAGAPIVVRGFVRYALGEGIDRPGGDFGGEVAALAGAH